MQDTAKIYDVWHALMRSNQDYLQIKGVREKTELDKPSDTNSFLSLVNWVLS